MRGTYEMILLFANSKLCSLCNVPFRVFRHRRQFEFRNYSGTWPKLIKNEIMTWQRHSRNNCPLFLTQKEREKRETAKDPPRCNVICWTVNKFRILIRIQATADKRVDCHLFGHYFCRGHYGRYTAKQMNHVRDGDLHNIAGERGV